MKTGEPSGATVSVVSEASTRLKALQAGDGFHLLVGECTVGPVT